MTKQGGFDEDLMQDLLRGLLLRFNPMQPGNVPQGWSFPAQQLGARRLAGWRNAPHALYCPIPRDAPFGNGRGKFPTALAAESKTPFPLGCCSPGYNSRPSACSHHHLKDANPAQLSQQVFGSVLPSMHWYLLLHWVVTVCVTTDGFFWIKDVFRGPAHAMIQLSVTHSEPTLAELLEFGLVSSSQDGTKCKQGLYPRSTWLEVRKSRFPMPVQTGI